jgi:DNA adenine methylase
LRNTPPPSDPTNAPPPAPFLKWAGGKRQLLHAIERLVPPRIDTYYEPFVGGGAVFFSLVVKNRFKRAVLGDANPELIGCYEAIRDDVTGVVRVLRSFKYDRDAYYEVREQDPATMTPAARAARLIYLNRCGFNGLYRVNSKGKFNVPFGRHTNPVICDEERLEVASKALQQVELVTGDFAEKIADATPRDFVYLDPPYVPVSATAYFTAYAQSPFGPAEQQRLAQLLRDLRKRRVPALLSNSDCAETRRLYKGLPFETADVRRSINSVSTSRGVVSELLVRSFAYWPEYVLSHRHGSPRRSAKTA